MFQIILPKSECPLVHNVLGHQSHNIPLTANSEASNLETQSKQNLVIVLGSNDKFHGTESPKLMKIKIMVEKKLAFIYQKHFKNNTRVTSIYLWTVPGIQLRR